MTVSLKTHTAIAVLFAAVLSLSTTAQTPAPNTTEWENEALKLRLFYSSDLVKADTAQIMHDGHITLFGIFGAPDPKMPEAIRCLRPALLLELLPSPSRLNAKVEPGFADGIRVTTTLPSPRPFCSQNSTLTV
jgi:hypothetical protein